MFLPSNLDYESTFILIGSKIVILTIYCKNTIRIIPRYVQSRVDGLNKSVNRDFVFICRK